MRISLCNEVIAGFDFARQCEFARAVGYDGLEIAPFTLDTLDEEPHRLSPARRAEIRRIARRDYRLALFHGCAAGPFDHCGASTATLVSSRWLDFRRSHPKRGS